jgi:hypothetical protein
MAVTSFGNQKGLIVCMDDSGTLSISYLGEYYIFVFFDVFYTCCEEGSVVCGSRHGIVGIGLFVQSFFFLP